MRITMLSIVLAVLGFAGQAVAADKEIKVATGSSVMAGTLSLPEGSPRAAILLIQGNGPHSRDQVISGVPMFKELADDLAKRGIATLRVDNSGVDASTGERITNYRQRIPQMTAVLDFAATVPELRGVPLGIFGHSEGSMVASEVWVERPQKVDFLILAGAPGRSGRTVWVEQQSNPDRFPGLDAPTLEQIRATFNQIAEASIANDRSAIETATDRLFQLTKLPAEQIKEVRPGFIDRMASDEMRVFLASEPAEAFSKVTGPVLAVWGTHDSLVNPAVNVPVFLNSRNAKNDLTVLVLPNEDHFFLRGDHLPPGKHKRGKMRLSAALPEAIFRYLDGR